MDTRRCSALRTNGEPCRKRPILGGTVCATHGGAAPQVQKSARARIEAMVDPALAELNRLISTAESDAVKLSAIKDVLDRAGLKPVDQVKQQIEGGLRVEVVYANSAAHPPRALPAATGDQS